MGHGAWGMGPRGNRDVTGALWRTAGEAHPYPHCANDELLGSILKFGKLHPL
jgi:hypothetical protein